MEGSRCNRLHVPRAQFLKACGALAAGAAFDRAACADDGSGAGGPDSVYVKSWELVESETRRKSKEFTKVTASDGSVGCSRALGGITSLEHAAQAVARTNPLDHEALYDAMVRGGAPPAQLKVMDIACWDLHARRLDKPLHALLGTKKQKILCYGDVRGQRPNFSPQKYAQSVRRRFPAARHTTAQRMWVRRTCPDTSPLLPVGILQEDTDAAPARAYRCPKKHPI